MGRKVDIHYLVKNIDKRRHTFGSAWITELLNSDYIIVFLIILQKLNLRLTTRITSPVLTNNKNNIISFPVDFILFTMVIVNIVTSINWASINNTMFCFFFFYQYCSFAIYCILFIELDIIVFLFWQLIKYLYIIMQ